MGNYMKLELAALSENEGFARSAVAAFALSLNPSLTELSDIKTAVSEAVTNCVVHAYKGAQDKILIECQTERYDDGGVLHITITDFGCGIEDVDKAVAPFFTTLSDGERSGMGFVFMEVFMDTLEVLSVPCNGCTVRMRKTFGNADIPE